MSLGPNDLAPCGTRSARKRHAAHGQLCLACEPDLERFVYCRMCRQSVRVVGEVVQPHPAYAGRTDVVPCGGAGRRVPFPKPVDVPIWVVPSGLNRRRVVALASIGSGAA